MLLDSPVCDFGWQAPMFTLPDLDGQPVALTDHMAPNGVLVAFICNHCPYVKAVIPRLVEDAKRLQEQGIATLAIMSNDYDSVPADHPDRMREFAAQHGFGFPYLLDQDQSVAKAWGAVCTPEFFGLNHRGELQYRGQLDNIRMQTNPDRRPDLLNAMLAIAKTGLGPSEQQASIGCSMKWR